MLRTIPFLSGVVIGALYLRERRNRRRSERFAAAALESLLKAIDANDPQTGAHVRRVARYALILADAIGVDSDDRRTIELTALFHDIGKIHEALFDLIHEPRELTPDERRAITTHPARGAEVLAPIAHFHQRLAEAVLAHHERWDGTGYPRGVKGNRIPLAARIVSIADTFDVITHGRRYRQGRTAREATNRILAARGTQFDPQLVDLLMLPPMFDQMVAAHREESRPEALPNRRDDQGVEHAPKVSFRWRTRSLPPEPVREKIAEARS